MPENVKRDGHQMVIANWPPHEKGSFRGFFSATTPSGMTLHDLMLHERDGERWVGLPAREWADASGKRQYVRISDLPDRADSNRFRDEVLAALDEHLEGGGS